MPPITEEIHLPSILLRVRIKFQIIPRCRSSRNRRGDSKVSWRRSREDERVYRDEGVSGTVEPRGTSIPFGSSARKLLPRYGKRETGNWVNGYEIPSVPKARGAFVPAADGYTAAGTEAGSRRRRRATEEESYLSRKLTVKRKWRGRAAQSSLPPGNSAKQEFIVRLPGAGRDRIDRPFLQVLGFLLRFHSR